MKISRNSMVIQRVHACARILRVETQKLREKLLERLQDLFALAQEMAQNKKIELSQRQKWVRVCAYVAQTMNSIAARVDEKQIDEDLKELERLVNEAKAKTESKGAQEGDKQPRKQRGLSGDPQRPS